MKTHPLVVESFTVLIYVAFSLLTKERSEAWRTLDADRFFGADAALKSIMCMQSAYLYRMTSNSYEA